MRDELLSFKTFALETLGCKVNRVESDSFQALLQQHEARIVPAEEADCIIVNTCTVTAEADKKARKTVRSLLKQAPSARIVVTGCAAALKPEMFTDLDPRIRVIERVELTELLQSARATRLLRLGPGFRTRVGVKIQDGCDNACTYCIVHVARGAARSVPYYDVCAEVEDYLAAGVNEVVLTGIDLGSYESNGFRLKHLLSELSRIAEGYAKARQPVARIRASSLEPLSVTDDLISLLALSDGRICRHLHVPVQSGSSKVLREMDRPYNADDFMRLAGKLHANIPSISLTTDIICGFPGETEADFESTMDLAREVGFSKIHVFPYSPREGTPAAARPDQIPPEVKADRAARLRALAEELREQDRNKRSGTKELVLIEDARKGLTESYHEIELDELGVFDPTCMPTPGSLIQLELP